MKRFIINIVLICAAGSFYAAAQQHEFSVHGGGGLSTLNYKLSMGERSGGGGGSFGVGYTYFRGGERASSTGTVLRDSWGIHTGVGLGFYSATARIDGERSVITGLVDNDTDLFDLHTILSGYTENQTAMLLHIPVMGVIQINQFYVKGGLKFGIPVSGKYQSKDATLVNEFHYTGLGQGVVLSRNDEHFAGFGTFPNRSSEGNIDLGVSTMLSFEAGMKFRIAHNLSLYAGAYFDYGLNNAVKSGNQPLVNFDPANPTGFTTNSVLTSLTEKVNTMSIGVKLRLAMIR